MGGSIPGGFLEEAGFKSGGSKTRGKGVSGRLGAREDTHREEHMRGERWTEGVRG